MPKDARIYTPDGKLVNSDIMGFDVNGPFFCANDGCDAKMHLVCRSGSQHFACYSISDHKLPKCIRGTVTFNASNYNEQTFNMLDFQNSFLPDTNCSKHIRADKYRTASRTINNNPHPTIKQIKTLYAAFLERGLDGNYNGYGVNDYLCSYDNYDLYCNGFTGFKLVELTYYHKVKGEFAIIFNYPLFDNTHNTHVKVEFANEQDFWNIYNHYRKLHLHDIAMNPLVIGAVWEEPLPSERNLYVAKCKIYKQTQHAYLRD